MYLDEYCKKILLGQSLADKLTHIACVKFRETIAFDIPALPARENRIQFSTKKLRFPKGHFHEVEKKAIALHTFANHELLAIEMMACALILYPHNTDELKRFKYGVVKSLQDEQKHFKLYVARLNDLGYEFGDFAINDFFWNQMHRLKTPSQYFAAMALTFEAANLDFAHFYKHIFLELGDTKTANILDIVLEDEITHVNLGVTYLNRWRGDKDLWTYYNESLPFPLTPARSMGQNFVEEARVKAKMDFAFIEKLKKYEDEFAITKRKEWKK
jgi:uncharacterized ferritin-like protein (DUF455 family)